MVFERKIYPKLADSKNSSKISLLFGPRQVGKTYLMKQVAKDLNHKFFNLELPQDSRIFDQSREEIFNLLTQTAPYIFIDEFHYLENSSQLFKAVYDWCDLHPDKQVKIFASGSSAIEMHKHLKESMAGRFKKFIIRPLSYYEYKSNTKIKTSMTQYLKFGGLPGTYDPKEHRSDDDKLEYLKILVKNYIQKDIKAFVNEENISSFNNMLYLLASWQGQVVPAASLAKETQVTEKTIVRYLDLLEQTFVLYKVKSFATNLSNELKKSKKYYLYDLGIRNSLLNDFDVKDKNNRGAIWETFVYHHLLLAQKPNSEIYFWRTSDDLEIDFIWLQDRKPTPIEVKSKLNKPEVPKAFKTFFKAYPNAPMGIVMNENLEETVWFMERPVYFVRFKDIDCLEGIFNPEED